MKLVVFGLAVSSSWGNGHAMIGERWPGLEAFFTPGEEMVIAERCDDVVAALEMSDAERERIAAAARARVLSEHTSGHRAAELERLLGETRAGGPWPGAGRMPDPTPVTAPEMPSPPERFLEA